jgi:hypothetical protein
VSFGRREGHTMKTLLDEEMIPDVPPEQRRVADLVKRIRKLRWLGMEQEAAKLQLVLARLSPAERAVVLTAPCDTD